MNKTRLARRKIADELIHMVDMQELHGRLHDRRVYLSRDNREMAELKFLLRIERVRHIRVFGADPEPYKERYQFARMVEQYNTPSRPAGVVEPARIGQDGSAR